MTRPHAIPGRIGRLYRATDLLGTITYADG